MKTESGRRIQLGEPIAVGAGAMIPYQPATPSLPPHQAPRRTQGERRIPGHIERSEVPRGHRSIAAAAVRASVAVLVALSGLAALVVVGHAVG
jgi:hypothetical protein